jgi:hypothetical protein
MIRANTHNQRPKITPEELATLDERFGRDPDGNYELLTGERQEVIGEVWDSRYVREKTIEFTSDIILALDGTDSERTKVIGDAELARQAPDRVIWMDKSARPVSWLVDAFWDDFAADGAPKPPYSFLNFERAEWFAKIGKTEQDYKDGDRTKFNADLLDEDEILRIRALFTARNIHEGNWRDEMRDDESIFEGEHIMVIDEVQATGGATTDIALGVLKRAFPRATISARYFWKSGIVDSITASTGERQMKSSPVWYKTNELGGRGIGDTNEDHYRRQYETAASSEIDPTLKTELFRQYLGAAALSEPLRGFDPLTAKLQQDIAYLTYAWGNGVLFRGTLIYDEDVEERIYNQQQLSTTQGREYRKYRSQAGVQKSRR